jgi:hypothetical protein
MQLNPEQREPQDLSFIATLRNASFSLTCSVLSYHDALLFRQHLIRFLQKLDEAGVGVYDQDGSAFALHLAVRLLRVGALLRDHCLHSA